MIQHELKQGMQIGRSHLNTAVVGHIACYNVDVLALRNNGIQMDRAGGVTNNGHDNGVGALSLHISNVSVPSDGRPCKRQITDQLDNIFESYSARCSNYNV